MERRILPADIILQALQVAGVRVVVILVEDLVALEAEDLVVVEPRVVGNQIYENKRTGSKPALFLL